MTSLPEQIAQLVLSQFDSLPLKCKPHIQPDGRREWTPLSAVVLVRGKAYHPSYTALVILVTYMIPHRAQQ